MRRECMEQSRVADPFRRYAINRKRNTGMTSCASGALVVQDDTEQRVVYLEPAVVLDESQLLEFVHEKIDARARGADHLGQGFLRYLGHDPLGLFLLAVAGKQQQSSGQSFLAGIEKLVDQILFNPDVALQHVGNEPV